VNALVQYLTEELIKARIRISELEREANQSQNDEEPPVPKD
jgi:hypothetical protein